MRRAFHRPGNIPSSRGGYPACPHSRSISAAVPGRGAAGAGGALLAEPRAQRCGRRRRGAGGARMRAAPGSAAGRRATRPRSSTARPGTAPAQVTRLPRGPRCPGGGSAPHAAFPFSLPPVVACSSQAVTAPSPARSRQRRPARGFGLSEEGARLPATSPQLPGARKAPRWKAKVGRGAGRGRRRHRSGRARCAARGWEHCSRGSARPSAGGLRRAGEGFSPFIFGYLFSFRGRQMSVGDLFS